RMEDMANDKSVDESGMYITKDMLQDSELKQSVNQYSEDDGNIVLLNVELSDDPFSKKAMNTVEKVEQSVTNQVKGTSFNDSQIEIGGTSAENKDLQTTIDNDMTKAIVLITIFLFVVLLVFQRSIIMPIYMIASILITYYASIGIANIIFDNIL